jgi:RHS repeat-associated protein
MKKRGLENCSRNDAKNQKIEYTYDDAGRRTEIKNFSATDYVNPFKTVNFTYNKSGNLITYNDGTTSGVYSYDDVYRKTSETVSYGSFALTYSYAYYKNGLKKSFTAPDGAAYNYTYDSNNQPAGISIPGQGYITYNSYTWNMPDSITLPGGTKREYSYNPLMQIKSLTAKDPGQNPFMNYNYQYSPVGNILNKTSEQGNHSYQYDPTYQLTNATSPTLPQETFTYDAAGNRKTAAFSGQPSADSYTYNTNNELLELTTQNSELRTYSYDDNGNMTSETDQTGTTTLTYDIDNRLIQIHNPQSEIYNYYYDPFGRRLWKDINGVRTYFLYADEGLIGEYDTTGNEIKTYGYAPNSTWTTNPLFQKIGTNYYWYQNDHLGTPQKIIDTSGRVVWSATYDAFGDIQIDVAEIENNLRFPGQYYDAETGLHYNYFRYYNPEIGRYISEDPIGLAGGDVNYFSYVGNNPINWIDPEGKWLFPAAVIITAAVTGLIVYITVDCLERCSKKYPCNNPEDPNRGANLKKCLDMCIPFLKFLGLNTPKGAIVKGGSAVGQGIGGATSGQ